MKRIRLGVKDKNKEYIFRETCFGVVFKGGEFYVTEKDGEISLIGGGVEKGESHEETLRREFMEEAGLEIVNIAPLITIDCYWHTKDSRDMNSLANFYIVDVDDRIFEPTEKQSKLVRIKKDEIISKLSLPYQIKAVEIFLSLAAG